MNELQQWLHDRDIINPHAIPKALKSEYEDFIGDDVVFWPQPGGQIEFHKCPADIVLYGGEAGGGKSFSILYEHIKWIDIPTYSGVIVRKEFSQIFDAGGLWDEAKKIYPHFGGIPVEGKKPFFKFPSGARVYFKHSQHAQKIVHYWQGLASPLICIDEGTQFSKEEFLYIMSRNRSTTGINSYLRITCNPDARSFFREMIDWWIDKDGFAIEARCGVIRYFVYRDDKFIWGDTREELVQRFGKKSMPKSFTFIRGLLKDNRVLLDADPEYEASLDNLTSAQKHALRGGNWNELDNPEALFNHVNINANRVQNINIEDLARIVVAVDPAGSTNTKSDETGIVVAGKDHDGRGYTLADKTGKYKPEEWAKIVCDLYETWKADKVVCEANYGGDMVKSTIMTHDDTIIPKMVHASKGKAIRAEPISALYSTGKICHVGNEMTELENEMCNWVPGDKSPNRMDAAVWAHTELFLEKPKRVPKIGGVAINV